MSALTGRFRKTYGTTTALALAVILAALTLSTLLGLRPSSRWIVLILAATGFALLLMKPELSILALIVMALVGPIEFNTGTEVSINPTTLLVPALMVVWVLYMVVQRRLVFVRSRVSLPLLLFLVGALLSLIIGRAVWDPLVPQSKNFLIVQLAQWAIFAFSAGAFWLTGNLIRDEIWLKRMVIVFLVIGGCAAILWAIPATQNTAYRVFTFATQRSPFWLLVAGIAGGQLLYNGNLRLPVRLALVAILVAVVVYTFVIARASISYWVGVGVALATLLWFRAPRLRLLVVVVLIMGLISGQLTSDLYQFAGGEREWGESGGARLALGQRVAAVTMRNPITGLGPAAYRSYARMRPLPYENAFWIAPNVSSHNNYIDLFAHTGILGLALFIWFCIEFIWLALRLRKRLPDGFAGGFIHGVLAAFIASLAIMVLADWILPFVYNIGFSGFQASVLVWTFMGGLLVYEGILERGSPGEGVAE